jgi:hypothetical protein
MLGHGDISLTVGTYGGHHQPDRRPNLDMLDRSATAQAEEAAAGWPHCKHRARMALCC